VSDHEGHPSSGRPQKPWGSPGRAVMRTLIAILLSLAVLGALIALWLVLELRRARELSPAGLCVVQRPSDFAGRARGANLGERLMEEVPALASRTSPEQASGPRHVGGFRGLESAVGLRDGAQAKDGQMPAALQRHGFDDGPAPSRAPGVATRRRRPPRSAVRTERVPWTPVAPYPPLSRRSCRDVQGRARRRDQLGMQALRGDRLTRQGAHG